MKLKDQNFMEKKKEGKMQKDYKMMKLCCN